MALGTAPVTEPGLGAPPPLPRVRLIVSIGLGAGAGADPVVRWVCFLMVSVVLLTGSLPPPPDVGAGADGAEGNDGEGRLGAGTAGESTLGAAPPSCARAGLFDAIATKSNRSPTAAAAMIRVLSAIRIKVVSVVSPLGFPCQR
ncbi:MAG: hypothetical protein ACR2NA_10495 [Solirubrobacterales bacterium]